MCFALHLNSITDVAQAPGQVMVPTVPGVLGSSVRSLQLMFKSLLPKTMARRRKRRPDALERRSREAWNGLSLCYWPARRSWSSRTTTTYGSHSSNGSSNCDDNSRPPDLKFCPIPYGEDYAILDRVPWEPPSQMTSKIYVGQE